MLQMAQNKRKSGTATKLEPEMSLYDRFQSLEMSLEDRARVDAAEHVRDRRSNENATISETVTPKWHVLEVFAGSEMDTVEWLAERGFGVFLPVYFVSSISRGRLVHRRRIVIPGYVFVFVWDIEAHRSRITACETVTKIMMDGETAAKVKDEDIQKLRAVELYLDTFSSASKKKRRRRRNRRNIGFYGELQDIKIEALFY
jgi:transcription antitermination factor NusG